MTQARSPSTEPAPGVETRGGGFWPSPAGVAMLAALAAAVTFLVVRDTLIDDTFITLDYARNLAFHLHWGLIAGETANSATSPLNVFVLAGTLAVVRNPTWTVGFVFVASYGAFGWCATRVARALSLPSATAVIAVAVTLLNPLLLSVVGMEVSTLGLVVFAVLLLAAIEERPLLFAITAGLALLIRLDLVVVVATFVIVVPQLRRRWWRISLVAGTLIAPWLAFSWIFLGSAIPDTLVIKQAQSWSDSFATGVSFYGAREPMAILVSFLPAVAGLLMLGRTLLRHFRKPPSADPRLRPVIAMGISGVAYFVVYALLAPPPYLWYYVPVIVALSTSGVLLASSERIHASALEPSRRLPRSLVITLVVVILAEGSVIVVNEARSWTRPPIVGNLATAKDYERIGRALRDRVGDAPVAIRGEIGALAYYCSCAILDAFSDRGIVVPLVEDSIVKRGFASEMLLGVNYAMLDRSQLPKVPAYYLDFDGPSSGSLESWPMTWLATGAHADVTLHRSPATPRLVSDLVDGVLDHRSRPSRAVVLHSDTGSGDADVRADIFLYAIAAEVHQRGIKIQLHHTGATGASVTVATGNGVDAALLRRHHRGHAWAYHGRVSLAERIRLARAARTLTASHRAHRMKDLDFLVAITAVRKQTKNDVLVYRG